MRTNSQKRRDESPIEEENPLEVIRMTVSITRGTKQALERLAALEHRSLANELTCLIREQAEGAGVLPGAPEEGKVIPFWR